MIMADVFKILFFILGLVLCTVSYWLLFQALFSESVERNRRAILSHPWRVFLTGLAAGLPLTLLGLAAMGNGAGPAKLLGGALVVAIITLALYGSTGLVRHIGARLSAEAVAGREGLTVLRGGAVVSIACVLPVVGWFFLLPVVLITGFGAAVRLLWTRRTPTVVAAAPNGLQA